MDLSIDTYSGVGPLRFGMSAEEVRTVMGLPFRTFKKTPAALLPTDFFVDVGLHVYYKVPGKCEAIEMATPAEPTLDGLLLIGRPFSEVREWFENRDDSVIVDGSGLTSTRYGVGLYAPHAAKKPREPIEGVIVFERGYYD